ncbi:unnamed protein product, partial [Sphacelaria rigidula]
MSRSSAGAPHRHSGSPLLQEGLLTRGELAGQRHVDDGRQDDLAQTLLSQTDDGDEELGSPLPPPPPITAVTAGAAAAAAAATLVRDNTREQDGMSSAGGGSQTRWSKQQHQQQQLRSDAHHGQRHNRHDGLVSPQVQLLPRVEGAGDAQRSPTLAAFAGREAGKTGGDGRGGGGGGGGDSESAHVQWHREADSGMASAGYLQRQQPVHPTARLPSPMQAFG